MNCSFVLTVISDDKPGIVEKIADAINHNHGNWLESNLSHLGGKFAGIVEFRVDKENSDKLLNALKALTKQGLIIAIEPTNNEGTAAPSTHQFTLVGNDRPGIIREISQAFALKGINVLELNTKCSSAPHVGTPLFEAWGKMHIPAQTDLDALETMLESLCDQLAVDLQFDAL